MKINDSYKDYVPQPGCFYFETTEPYEELESAIYRFQKQYYVKELLYSTSVGNGGMNNTVTHHLIVIHNGMR